MGQARSTLITHNQVDFLKTPGNRKRLWVTILLGMGSNWVGNGILG